MIFNSIVLQVLISILVISLLIAWHELGHYSIARLVGMRVIKFSIGFGPKIIRVVKNKIEYQISLLPVGGYVHIAGMTSLEEGAKDDPKSFINQPKWAQLLVVSAGPAFNYILAIVIFICVFWLWSPTGTPSLLINQVAKDSAAQIAGMKENDIVTHINNLSVTNSRTFIGTIQNSLGENLDFTVERTLTDNPANKQILHIIIKPEADSTGAFKIGVGYVPLSFTFIGAVKESFSQVWQQSVGILSQLGQTIFGNSSSQLGGIVEITRQLTHATEKGFKTLLWLAGSLSVGLGLINLLPIPALDGSKIFFICLESITRKPIPEKAQLWIHVIGIIFILGLMLLLTVSDVLRIYSGS